MHTLRADISRYREVARTLHAHRKATADQPSAGSASNVHTSMGLKYNHIRHDFAHLELLDSVPMQTDLFADY